MIDTITIRLEESQFRILDHNKFSPNTYNFFYPPYSKMGGRGYIDAYQNPKKSELKEGIYKPQLTLRKRWQNTEALNPSTPPGDRGRRARDRPGARSRNAPVHPDDRAAREARGVAREVDRRAHDLFRLSGAP